MISRQWSEVKGEDCSEDAMVQRTNLFVEMFMMLHQTPLDCRAFEKFTIFRTLLTTDH